VLSPISKDQFEKAKLEKEGYDVLCGKILSFLRNHNGNAYSTSELMEIFNAPDTETIRARCEKMYKKGDLDCVKPNHTRVYFWIAKRKLPGGK